MPTRILHVSDLHVGRRDDPAVEPALARLIARVGPELIVASGDLTHRGRREQHERAAALLRGFGLPLVAVPGNHDIPYSFPARFTGTYREFERTWGTTRPVYRSDELLVVGLNSVRPWRQQSGRVRGPQVAWAAEQLASAPAGALRVVVLHHHLIAAPWRSRKRPLAHRDSVLPALADAGAELILAGHIHQSAVSERREFEVLAPGRGRSAVLAVAPGLGRPRPNRRGEAHGLQVYEAQADELGVETYVWREDGWALVATRRFPRGGEPAADV